MKKLYLLTFKNLNQNLIIKFIHNLNKDIDNYINLVEFKYNDTYENIKKNYGIKKFRKSIDTININECTITYQYKYPKKDKSSPDLNLSHSWGYYMVFKSLRWRLKDKLKVYFLNHEYKINKFFKLKVNGYFIKIRVLNI